ncbi:2,3-bisphosphoglycerate-independent phosphoglycerate mutase [Sulfitobacter sp. M220]|jgi:2,3-bisphosphoglycerate-independent phosphoglycerate mutase|uniref:2,3-bisphosphoglycerate-independent phosphoglycerate mutase n=1 Tax=Sulfitobacter TaxID=60136 RepID=UPI001EEFA1F4|nr:MULTISPECIES: 2,3-bisphosphoglycerate-independent phosphoglycerate mutase [unclassified Sulfitobacter]MCF7727565.1 2,3-bisphosphoglycerate-independent phosphoglycerate mutase [Sulfitobacter sp. M22]MCF7778925.1 2,3-bisphosphoglycerate-independent phosphoglycerate mutase [Sulfitobacter sp. M220]|tara:strand:- start:2021 stop:3538 length:1518 start_codon:yes stop_codon:yes gene_type:complete
MNTPKPVVLCILDGWGLCDDPKGNAPLLAKTPHFDRIMQSCPSATLTTFGPDVGLPQGQMGNSEVGHTNIGAGRVVAMDLGQIDLAIEEGAFAKHQPLIDFIATLKKTGGTAHLMGLVSDGGVHGHLTHMIVAVHAICDHGVPVVIHALTDGRDVAPRSALGYFETLQAALPDGASIATVLGRYFAMDRDNRWDRVAKAYEAIVLGKGRAAPTASAAVTDAYGLEENDEFITPTVLHGYEGVQDGDGVFCLNFRADRAREIMSALAAPDFDAFDTGARPAWSAVMGMAEYSDAHMAFMTTMYPKPEIVNTLGAWVAQHGLRQFRLAETEKYPHVTFFLNGGAETPTIGEDRFMPKSPNVATYDLQPEMSCGEVTDHFVQAIKDRYDLIVVNYANPDMVGHTGDLDAAIAACEAVDTGLGRVLEALEDVGGAMIVTADHGNCETMIDPETGGAHTAHTLNPVPVAVVGGPEGASLRTGRLADLAPTVLQLMGLDQPVEMTGKSLLE